MRIAVVGTASNDGTVFLVEAWRERGLEASLMPARSALEFCRPGDVCIARLDVLGSLDGVEPGLLELLLLERRGVRVVNAPDALLGAHDKLRTARLLASAGLPHPPTVHLRPGRDPIPAPPVVLKPRFGSWGKDVELCADEGDVARYLAGVGERPWFRRHGVLAQQPVPSEGRDLRVLVAAGRIVGAAERVARAGEWRTNVSCGGRTRPVDPPPAARELAATAAAVVGIDFVGVDLLPVGDEFVVLELNGAVDFDPGYSLPGEDVFAATAAALGLDRVEQRAAVVPLGR